MKIKNYLNFYIPFVKPESNKSGLGVIPFDRLESKCQSKLSNIINSGANRFFPKFDITEVYDDNSGEDYILPVNLDTLAEYPELNAGDLLLMRGDIIHKTQDTITNRVALTVRCVDGEFVLNKEKLLNTCPKKQEIMNNNQRMYNNILKVFGSNTQIQTKKIYEDESCLIATK